jgi:hypothetical protein
VLTVVAEDAIAILAEARTRPARHFAAVETGLARSYPDCMPLREGCE